MVESNDLLCLFSAEATRRDGSVVLEIPDRELEVGDIEEGGIYRVGVYETGESSAPSRSRTARPQQSTQEPPVEEGEVIDVEIEDMGEEGDGIARVGPGYVVFVPETVEGERVAVEITTVKQNVAFGAVVERHDR
jgi:predicted RNA-binding protein with TRAM domain